MPYTKKNAPVKDVLPDAALDLWVSTFNSVAKETGDEDQARKAAWSNVKKAGYEKGKDGQWHKASGEIADTASVAVEATRLLDRAVALALPTATPSKVYAEFRFFRFNIPNENRDGFRPEDVSEEVVAALVGSPLYLDTDWDEHPAKTKRATDRAKFQAGTITQAEKREDGVYCVGAFQREVLEDRGIDPKRLAEFSTSMEVMFDRATSHYRLGTMDYTYQDALEAGIAAPVGSPDDRSKYDARYIVPIEFHAGALLARGHNADRGADVLRAAASEEEVMPETQIISEAEVKAFLARGVGDGIPIHDRVKTLREILAVTQQQRANVASAAEALEERIQAIRDAFYQRYSQINGSYCYVLKTYEDYLISEAGSDLYRVDYKSSKDGYDFAEPREVEIVYKNVKKEAASVSDQTKPKNEAPTDGQPEPLTPEKRKEIEEAAVAAARPGIEKEAIEAHLTREQTFVGRMKALESITPFSDAEKADLEKKVRGADEAGFTAIKMERMEAALAGLLKDKAVAGKDKPNATVAPALRGGAEEDAEQKSPFRVTIRKE